ncbi:Cyclin-t1-5, partial [Thalictrum thalictroides]
EISHHLDNTNSFPHVNHLDLRKIRFDNIEHHASGCVSSPNLIGSIIPCSLTLRSPRKDVYEQQKELILLGERVVLTTLGFDFNILHPYKPLVEAIKKLKVAQNSLAQVAWNFVNDGLRTSLCLQFKPHHIAAGAIFLAAKFLKVKLPSEGEKVWWKEFDVTSRQLEEVSNQMLELYEQNRLPASQGSDVGESVGGRASHHTPAKPSTAHGKSDSARHTQVEGVSSVKPGPSNPSSTWSDQSHANHQSGSHRNSRNIDHASTESKNLISEHRLDDEIKEHRHPEQRSVSCIRDNAAEASDISRIGTEPHVKEDVRRENGRGAIKSEEENDGTTSSNIDSKVLENKDPVSIFPEACIKEKVKAALEKRKKSRGDVTRKKELMDDDDLIERELEDGVELAVEDEKVKRENRQDQLKFSNSSDPENSSYETNHQNIGNGSYLETERHDVREVYTDSAEEGELYLLHDAERIRSPIPISRKRKAESPDGHLDRQHHDYIPGHQMNHIDNIGDRGRISKLGYVERDQKRHVQENPV